MALYCSKEIFQALDGLLFPATKDDLLDLAELKDAPEAVIVTLEKLSDSTIYHNISEVCENARIACNSEVVSTLLHVMFPADRDQLIEFADRYGAQPAVRHAIEALPSGYTYRSIDEVCEYVL
jgi:hypothetical protein